MVGSLKGPISLKELITVIDNNACLDLILITGCSLGCVTVETNLKDTGEVIILKAHNFLKAKQLHIRTGCAYQNLTQQAASEKFKHLRLISEELMHCVYHFG